MTPGERDRRLKAAGWTFAYRTAHGHVVWHKPDGTTAMVGTDHPSQSLHRRDVEKVKRAERDAHARGTGMNMKTQALVTASEVAMMTPELAQALADNAGVETFTPQIKARVSSTQGVLYFGDREQALLGERVGLEKFVHGWCLVPGRDGWGTPVRRHGGGWCASLTTGLRLILPETATADLPAALVDGKIVLYPKQLVPRPLQPVPEPAPELPVSEPAAPEPALAPALTPTAALRLAMTLDDLRTALELVRQAAAELGAELYFDGDGTLRARIVL